MKKLKVNTKSVTKTFEKMLKDKEMVVSYMKGKTTQSIKLLLGVIFYESI